MSENVPNNPSLWAKAQAEARRKFKVHPSAYSNAFASKRYKAMGGTWRKKTSTKKKSNAKKR
tara:strand:- start:2 stop:187 length:186 start_codon:yes stop_codon:yes gene_type:complete